MLGKPLALPSEARENSEINRLPDVLGKSSVIDIQDVSGSRPKQSTSDIQASRIARLYAVSHATAETLARLAYTVAP